MVKQLSRCSTCSLTWYIHENLESFVTRNRGRIFFFSSDFMNSSIIVENLKLEENFNFLE